MGEQRNAVLLFCASVLSTTVAAQLLPEFKFGPPPGGWPAEIVEHYQPIVKDSTLLFPAPWLVWHCICEWKDEYEFYSEVDFRAVSKCWGRKEVFDRVEVRGVYSFVQRGLGQLHATLEPTADGFLYAEVPLDSAETAKPLRIVPLVWDTDHVVRTDTMLFFAYSDTIPKTLLKRCVELKRAP
jgi:hypothetical protein